MKVKNLVYYSMAIALTLLLTWILQIPYFVTEGYLNLGDVGVLLSGLLFGPVGGMIAGAVGSSLADIISGYALYAPFTFVIKGLEGYLAGFSGKKNIKIPSFFICLLSALVMVVGYFIAEWFLYGLAGSIVNVAGNTLQAVVGASIASIVYTTMKNTGVVKYIEKRIE